MASPESHVKTMDLITEETNDQLAVASAGTAYTRSFLMPFFSSAAIEYRFTSDTNVDVKVEIESGNDVPDTEGSADTDEYGVGNTISSGITDQNVHWNAPSPTVSKYCRLKLTGQGGNGATTKLVQLRLHYIPG